MLPELLVGEPAVDEGAEPNDADEGGEEAEEDPDAELEEDPDAELEDPEEGPTDPEARALALEGEPDELSDDEREETPVDETLEGADEELGSAVDEGPDEVDGDELALSMSRTA